MSQLSTFMARIPRQSIAVGGAVLLIAGLVASKFLISLGMIVLLAASLLSPDFGQDFQRLKRHRALLVSMGIVLILLLSGFNTSNWDNLFDRLRIALPFVVIPFAFGLLPPFPKRIFKGLLYYFIIIITLSAIAVLINYIWHFEEIQFALKISKAIPTPQEDHIRYSLLLCLAIFSAGWLVQQRYYFRWKAERYLLLLLAVFLWLMLHILAVRSGLLAFYLGMLIWLIWWMITQRKWLIGLSIIVLMAAIPITAYYTLPSFRMKVHLTLYNYQQFQQGEIGNLSDTQRLLSYRIALQVAQQNPWTGVGMGDLQDEQRKVYERDYPQQRVMYPHNQFLSFYAGTGLIGLLAFVFCFFYPLFYARNYCHPWMLLFYTIIFSSFLTENTLFIAIGTAIYCFFMGIFINTFNHPLNTNTHEN